MRKIILKSLLAISLAVTTGLYAQIPNASFENWTTVGGVQKPDGWRTYDIPGESPTITPSTPGYNSSTALEMTIKNSLGYNWCSDMVTGFQYNKRSMSMVGYLKSNNPQHDTLDIGLFFFNNKQPIGGGYYQTDTNAAAFYKFTMPIQFIEDLDPDSALIYITYLSEAPTLGDAFIIDELSFPSDVFVESKSNSSDFKVGNFYPIPANDYVIIPVKTSTQVDLKIQVYDLAGKEIKLIRKEHIGKGINNIEIPVSDLPGGLYIMSIENNNGFKITKKLIIE